MRGSSKFKNLGNIEILPDIIKKIAKKYLMSEKNVSDPLSIFLSIIKEYKE